MTLRRCRSLPAAALVAVVILTAAWQPRPVPQAPTLDPRAPSPQLRDPSPAPRVPPLPSWADILRQHLRRYPLAEAQDVYKLVHQSVFGPSHAVPSREVARTYLLEELAALPPGPAGEPLLDPLGDAPPLARVNLRPYVAAGYDPECLLDAFVATANQAQGRPEAMRDRLLEAAAVLREAGLAAVADRLDEDAAAAAAAGYPAVHHGEAYREAYHPAYRVVLRTLLGACTPGQAPARAAATQPELR